MEVKCYCAYILASKKNGTLYVGVTSNLRRRMREHREGLVPGFTSRYRIFRLVHFETFGDIRLAIAREKETKAWRREKKIWLIERHNPAWAPSEKKYRHYRENCLQFRNEKCGKCIPRCPAGAITEKGHDKDKCKEYVDSEALKKKRTEYGLQNPPPSCGLCQTDVPCEFQIPRPNLIA